MTGRGDGRGGRGGGRQVARVAAGILLTRVLGYVRERVFAHYFGNSAVADALRAALRIPNLLRNLLGEGTLSASFIPVYAALNSRTDRTAARALAGGVLGLLLLAVGVLALVGIGFAPTLATMVAPGFDAPTRALTITLLRILFPMAGVMVVSAWCLGILNTHGRFFLPYAAPALWNVAGIAALVGAATWVVAAALPVDLRLHRLALALAWGTVAGSLLQVAVQLPTCWRLLDGIRARLGLRLEGLRDVLVAWVPVVVGAGVGQISSLVDTILGSLVGEGGVASLAYAQTLQILPISLFGVSVAAVALPALSRDAAAHPDREALRERLATGLRRVTFFVIPSAFAFAGLGTILVAALFQTGRFSMNDSQVVGGVLAAYGVGLPAAASTKLVASGFYSLRDTRTPVLAGVGALILSTGLAVALMRPFGSAGIALAASVGAVLSLVAQLTLLDRRVGPVVGAPERRALLQVTGAALAATGTGVAVAHAAASLTPVPRAALACLAFSAVYFALTLALRHPDALRLWTSLRISRGS